MLAEELRDHHARHMRQYEMIKSLETSLREAQARLAEAQDWLTRCVQGQRDVVDETRQLLVDYRNTLEGYRAALEQQCAPSHPEESAVAVRSAVPTPAPAPLSSATDVPVVRDCETCVVEYDARASPRASAGTPADSTGNRFVNTLSTVPSGTPADSTGNRATGKCSRLDRPSPNLLGSGAAGTGVQASHGAAAGAHSVPDIEDEELVWREDDELPLYVDSRRDPVRMHADDRAEAPALRTGHEEPARARDASGGRASCRVPRDGEGGRQDSDASAGDSTQAQSHERVLGLRGHAADVEGAHEPPSGAEGPAAAGPDAQAEARPEVQARERERRRQARAQGTQGSMGHARLRDAAGKSASDGFGHAWPGETSAEGASYGGTGGSVFGQGLRGGFDEGHVTLKDQVGQWKASARRLIAGAGRAFVAGRQVVSELFALVREVSRVASLLRRS